MVMNADGILAEMVELVQMAVPATPVDADIRIPVPTASTCQAIFKLKPVMGVIYQMKMDFGMKVIRTWKSLQSMLMVIRSER